MIIEKIKKVLGLERDADLANALGVTVNTIASWKARDSFSALLDTLIESNQDIKITIADVQIFPSVAPAHYKAFLDSILEVSLHEKRGEIGVADVLIGMFSKPSYTSSKDKIPHFPNKLFSVPEAELANKEALRLINEAGEGFDYALENRKEFVKQLKKIRIARKVLLGG